MFSPRAVQISVIVSRSIVDSLCTRVASSRGITGWPSDSVRAAAHLGLSHREILRDDSLRDAGVGGLGDRTQEFELQKFTLGGYCPQIKFHVMRKRHVGPPQLQLYQIV